MSKYTVTVEEDANGDAILPFPKELIEEAGWLEGDELEFIENADGSFTIENLSLLLRQVAY